jgi:nucleoside-diphosphate-sugar epimerase
LAGIWGEMVAVLTGRMPVVNRDKVRDLLQPYWTASIDRLLSAGYAPRIRLAEGMRETLEWYRAEGWL